MEQRGRGASPHSVTEEAPAEDLLFSVLRVRASGSPCTLISCFVDEKVLLCWLFFVYLHRCVGFVIDVILLKTNIMLLV